MLKYTYKSSDNILYVSGKKDYTTQDIIYIGEDVLRAHRQLKTACFLNDFQKLKLKYDTNTVVADMANFSEIMRKLANQFSNVYVATVLGPQANQGLVDFFMKMKKPSNYHVQVFKDYEEGKAWLMAQS